MTNNKSDQERLLISHTRLRRIVGVLGLGLPFYLAIASFVCSDATALEDTISDYYSSAMQNEFVGILCVIGAFLFVYRGYDAWDDWMGHLAGLSAVGVALFPVTSCNGAIRTMHYLCALVLFLTLAGFSRYLFTKSRNQIERGTPKEKRNKVYTWCAYVMLLCIFAIGIRSVFLAAYASIVKLVAVIVLVFLMVLLSKLCFSEYCLTERTLNYLSRCRLTKTCFKNNGTDEKNQGKVNTWCACIAYTMILSLGALTIWHLTCMRQSFPIPFVFAAETVLLIAFGISWFVKGDTLLRDNKHDNKQCP